VKNASTPRTLECFISFPPPPPSLPPFLLPVHRHHARREGQQRQDPMLGSYDGV